MEKRIRITGGIHRGRKITTPGGKTHPMGERERIALFNMISEYIPGAKVLDVYAGSGALGLEALSRGAKEVTFVDHSKVAESCILDNLRLLDCFESQEIDVQRIKVTSFQTDQRFGIIFADPPYNNYHPDEIAHLVNYLEKGGALVLSHPDVTPEFEGLKLLKSRNYAGATISIFVKT